MRDADDYAKDAMRKGYIRGLYLKAMYPIWHRDELSPMPPAYAVDLAREMPPGNGPGFVCIACQRAYADRPRFTLAISTAADTHTFARCATCAAQANYRDNR